MARATSRVLAYLYTAYLASLSANQFLPCAALVSEASAIVGASPEPVPHGPAVDIGGAAVQAPNASVLVVDSKVRSTSNFTESYSGSHAGGRKGRAMMRRDKILGQRQEPEPDRDEEEGTTTPLPFYLRPLPVVPSPVKVGEEYNGPRLFYKVMDGCSVVNSRRRYLRRRTLPQPLFAGGVREEYTLDLIGEVACCAKDGSRCTRTKPGAASTDDLEEEERCLSPHRRRDGGRFTQMSTNEAAGEEMKDKAGLEQAAAICSTLPDTPVLCSDQASLDLCCGQGCGGDDEWYWTSSEGRQ
eukprot:TRINITY_DN82424_c0_g1_i1.p1 TRINITY_DN82424_c0_g1~~TRINITY_DN82424_c0_g1_i1.p1  ORF type:complete len:299 (+),score=52.00 TRINITY_DN82424_c0_g1_i1:36-932(+)